MQEKFLVVSVLLPHFLPPLFLLRYLNNLFAVDSPFS